MADEANVRLKPLFLVKPKTMSAKDIRRAEKLAGICIVECEEPDEARFLEPPIDAQIDVQARAALSLMRKIITYPQNQNFGRDFLLHFFVDALMNAAKPSSVPVVKPVKK